MMTENVKKNNFINSIITVGKNNTITEADESRLEEVASRKTGSDPDVIEDSDMTPEEKLALAKQNPNYNKHYKLSLSADKQYLVVEVKETARYYPDPYIKTIKSDFGLSDDVLVRQGGIPYGNEKTINERIDSRSYVGNNLVYDEIELQAGDKINIPIEEVSIQSKSAGFWSFDRPWF